MTENLFNKRTCLVLIIYCLLFSCEHKNNTMQTDVNEEETETLSNDSIVFAPFEKEIWVDNFLSDNVKDTIQVKLYDPRRNKYLDSIPVDSTMDWWIWYQQNDIETVLFLKDIKPLHLDNSCGLLWCCTMEENGNRAISIVKAPAQTSSCVVCEIYKITDNRWKFYKRFGTRTWCCSYEEDGNVKNSEFAKYYLLVRNGRWMYRDIDRIITEEDTDSTWYFVFDK